MILPADAPLSFLLSLRILNAQSRNWTNLAGLPIDPTGERPVETDPSDFGSLTGTRILAARITPVDPELGPL